MKVEIRKIYKDNNVRSVFIKGLFEFIKCGIEPAKFKDNF